MNRRHDQRDRTKSKPRDSISNREVSNQEQVTNHEVKQAISQKVKDDTDQSQTQVESGREGRTTVQYAKVTMPETRDELEDNNQNEE